MALPPLAILGVGDNELLLIGAVILIFFGGDKMPELAKGLGKIMREFRRATGEVEREFKRVMDEAEHQTVGQVRTTWEAPPKTQAKAEPFIAPPLPPALPAPPVERPILPHRFQPDAGEDFHSDI